MTLFQLSLLPAMLAPMLNQGFVTELALENAATALDERSRHRLEKNPLGGRLDYGSRAALDVELPSQSKGDDYLSFRREPHGFSFSSHTHYL
jgi:hypothetical protein